jgi:LPS-assembly lipoprotein
MRRGIAIAVRRLALAAGLAAVLPALGGCGFEPLYGKQEDGPGVTAELAQVYVMPIPNRLGQILYNYLRDRVVPYGQPGDPKYVLAVALGQNFSSAAIRPDATASRLNVTMQAFYYLYDAQTRKLLTQGVAQSMGAYNVRAEPYPTLVSRQDVESRISRDLGDEVRNRLAIYFSSPPRVVPPTPTVQPQRLPPPGTEMQPIAPIGTPEAGVLPPETFGAGPSGMQSGRTGAVGQPQGLAPYTP